MSEATGHEARTIHRLLEYNGRLRAFQRNSETPLECDLLVVDEASMIDSILFSDLMKAVGQECRLILVGDIHQLPSVGPGNVLKDLIESGAVPVVELNEIFRQAQKSGIVVNAHRVNAGAMPDISPRNTGLSDFYFVREEDPEKCVGIILALVSERIPQRFGFDPMHDVQVLSPMHRGLLGVSNLNAVLQKSLNPGNKPTIERGGRFFKAGDKVMQTRNDYDKDVYNGDIGFISMTDPEAGILSAEIDGRPITYERQEIDDELIHAYAVSIHKSQGSEYPAVIIPVHTQHYVLLQRNLLYTGITRGRKLVVLVGTKKAVSIAVANDDTRHRCTYLCERLRQAAAI
jgi:exodeoxyribonuclease V alpha subunit